MRRELLKRLCWAKDIAEIFYQVYECPPNFDHLNEEYKKSRGREIAIQLIEDELEVRLRPKVDLLDRYDAFIRKKYEGKNPYDI